MRFLLDTNFLLIPGKFRVDIVKELERFGKPELYTIDLVVKELGRLAEGSGREASDARVGLELLRLRNAEVLGTSGKHADDEIEEVAKSHGLAVCTQDRGLQKRLSIQGVEVFYLRQRSRIDRL